MNNINLDTLLISMGEEVRKLLKDKDVIEIYLNDDKKLWIDTLSEGRKFTGIEIDPQTSKNIIYLIANSVNAEVNEQNPTIDAELPTENRERFSGLLPPVVKNPSFAIRKKAIKVFTLEDYVKNGIMTEKQLNIIKDAVKTRKNILVVGGVSTGKTTLTNAIIKEIAKYKDRLVLIEDTQELQCETEDRLFLRSTDHVTIRKLLKQTLRLRPDRIIIGEIRDGVALNLIKAWNTGHPGGVCTLHANSALEGLDQLESYISEVSMQEQKKTISKTVNLVINIRKIGLERKIYEILKLNGLDENGNYIYEYI